MEKVKVRCKISLKKLSFYLDGRYMGKKEAIMEGHISLCAHCKERLNSLSLLRHSLNNLNPVRESTGFEFEFNRKLNQRLEKLSRRRFRIKVLEDILGRMGDAILYPIPQAVKVAASFILVIAVLSGVRMQALQKLPGVEFVAGDVKIYRPDVKRWITPCVDMRLKAGDRIKTEEGAVVNILSGHRYKMRIKDDSLMVLSRVDCGLGNIDTAVSISHGNMLVNTTDKFKGSQMKIYTPACDAEVVGTAFYVKVIPELNNSTWLGVLEGKVKVLSKVHPLKAMDMKQTVSYVGSGQKIVVEPYKYPSIPELFSEKEWRTMQELYQLTEVPQIILLIGIEADRIEQLLKPAPVYIPDIRPRTVPLHIQNAIDSIINATREGSIDLLSQYVKELELLLKSHPNPRYDVEILMFIASHYHYTGDYKNALRVFEKVINEYPNSHRASLAQCAIATIYQNDLKDVHKAEDAYRLLISVYPDSVDAIRARESLTAIR